MKITRNIFLLSFCLLWNLVSGQVSSSHSKPLSIGDTVPNILFENIINYKTTSARLSDFKGKLVILDFWATWCRPCVAEMPKMDSLQRRFDQQLVVLPISNEKENTVAFFFNRRPSLKLPSAILDSMAAINLLQLFPYNSIPHAVIIDATGKIQAITSTPYINEQTIKTLLLNENPELPVKQGIGTFKYNQPLLSGKYENVLIDPLTYSLVSRRISDLPGFGSEIINDTGTIGFHLINLDIPKFYVEALLLPDWYTNSRIVLENVRDSSRYIKKAGSNKIEKMNWISKNVYCYEIVAPHLTEKERLEVMMKDLNSSFGYLFGTSGFRQKRLLSCYALIKKSKKPNFKTDGGHKIVASTNDTDEIIYSNVSMGDLANALELQINIPFTDETALRANGDFRVNKALISKAKQSKDLTALKAWLNTYGLDLVKCERLLDALVIREN